MATSTTSNSTFFGTSQPGRFDALGLVFDAICIEVRNDINVNIAETASLAVAETLGSNWEISPTDDKYEFDVTHPNANFTYRQGWSYCHQLLKHSDIFQAFIEYLPFDVPEDAISASGLQIGRFMLLSTYGNDVNDERTEDKEWALKDCKIPQAWELVRKAGEEPGEGITIGHPDSGYRKHDEMDEAQINKKLQWDFVNNDNCPISDHGNHGLGTASVIMSGPTGEIKGPAMNSKIVPLRVVRERWKLSPVVLLSLFGRYRRFRRALVYAEDKGFEVISVSLGGFSASYKRRVRKRLKKLWNKGVIVVAAAGNIVKLGSKVVFGPTLSYPGRWPETIAVAASSVNGKLWKGSCRGIEVDISAPGDSVWHALINDAEEEDITRSAGTSYSTALVSGVAAMWRSYRADDLTDVPKEQIPQMFRKLLETTADTDHDLEPEVSGSGILDAHALLEADLPDISDSGSGGSTGVEGGEDIDFVAISDSIDTLKNDLPSISSLVGLDLTGLSPLEAHELEAALELEVWDNALSESKVSGTILDEVSPELAKSLKQLEPK